MAIAAAACSGCGIWDLFIPEGSSKSRDFSRIKGITNRKIWENLQEAVNEEYNIKLANDEEMRLETEWNEHLGPMFKTGRRYMVCAKVLNEEGELFVETTVRREINANVLKPLDRRDAEWEDDGRDESREQKIIWLLTMRLVKFGPSDRSLNPDKSDYLTSEENKQEDKLWSDTPAEGGGSGGGRRPPDDIWKD